MRIINMWYLIVTATLICCTSHRACFGQNVYWTHNDVGDHVIQRANLDGSDVEVSRPDGPFAVAVDMAHGNLYWFGLAGSTDGVHRIRFDGTALESLFDTGSARGRALDLLGEKRYWTDTRFFDPGSIGRCNLDGSKCETLVDNLQTPWGIALDLSAGKMYWTERTPGRILRADVNGSNVETLITQLSQPDRIRDPRDVALDVSGGKVYWTDCHTGLHRANLDGSKIQPLMSNVGVGLALDLQEGKIYGAGGTVFRANLDGSDREALVPDAIADAVPGIALDLCGRQPGGLRWDDHDAYLDCLIGPGGFAPTACHCSDFSGDAHVDLKDFALVQRAFTSE